MKNNSLGRIVSCILAAIVVTEGYSYADNVPVYSVQSPDAANIGLFGSVPVGLFTGTPEVSVPLFEFESGTMKYPVSLDYHLSSVKPNQYPGCVGIGWTLNCGGCISRTVRGVYDEKYSTYGNGYYYHYSEMNNISNSEFDRITATMTEATDDRWYELSADEFSFSFFGYNGNFYLAPTGVWTVVSDQDIKVEMDGLAEYSSLSGRIPGITTWPNRSKNTKFFRSFTLITPDGCRYTFGGINATDFCIPYYSRTTDDLIATAWHLSRIMTPEGREITFDYSTDAVMVDLRYIPGDKTTSGVAYSDYSYLYSVNTGRKGFSGYLLYPVNISAIHSTNDEVIFEYHPDWRYGYTYSRYGRQALYWSQRGQSRSAGYDLNKIDPATQFSYLFPASLGGSDNECINTIAESLIANVLYGIKIKKPRGTAKTILFSYIEEARRKLERIAWREGEQSIDITYYIGGGEAYPFFSIPENESGIDMPEYSFKYNEGKMPHGYVFPQADKWGYYNGLMHIMSDNFNFMSTPSNTQTAKYETLHKIIYPTGGSTVFEYEGHNYSKLEMPSHFVMDAFGLCGGLRVRRIIDRDRNNAIVSDRMFYYSESPNMTAQSSGVARMQQGDSVSYACGNGVSMRLRSKYGFGLPVTNLNSPDVGYSCVIEESLDKDGNSMGYIVNRFSNFDNDIYGNSHLDNIAYHTFNISSVSSELSPYTSNSQERGKLLSRKWYNADNTLVREEEYHYARVLNGSFPTATQRIIYFSTDPQAVYSAAVGWLTLTNTYSYLPVQVVTRENGYEESTSTTYNSAKLKQTERTVTSDGHFRVSNYLYPGDFPSLYGAMISRHFLSPIVEQTSENQSDTQTISRTYRSVSYLGRFVPYLSKVETQINNSPGKTELEVLHADIYGNPTEIVENNLHSVLVWDRTGQKLTKRICDITLEEYELNPLDHGKMTWQYVYDGNLRLIMETNPDGIATHYSYDQLDRLSETYYYNGPIENLDKKIIETNRYYYQK